MYEIVDYQDHEGRSPLRDFLIGLEPADLERVHNRLTLLSERGFLPFPLSSDIRGYPKLRELRIQSRGKPIRLLYFLGSRRRVVVLGGLVKHSEKEAARQMEAAFRRMKDWLERMG